MDNMGKRLLMGIVSGAGSVFFKHALNVLLLPILIHTLGVELFSLYMILIGIQELTLLLDMGFTDAVVKQLSASQGSQNHQQYGEIKKMGHTLFGGVSLLSLIIGFSLIPFFPHWLHFDSDLHGLSQIALAIILLEGTLTLYITYYKALLLTHCLNHWSNIGDSIFNLIGIGVGVGLLIAGYGLTGLLLARLAGALIRAAIVIIQTVKIESDAFWPQAAFNLNLMKEMVRLTFHAMMVNLSVIVSHKIDTFVIAFFLPLTAVGFYEIVFRFLGSALQVCIRVCDSIFPLFARLMAAAEKQLSEKDKARHLFLRMSCFNNFVISTLLMIIVCFYPELFSFFSAGRMDIGPTLPVLAIAVPVIWSSALQIPACYFLYTANRQRYLTVSSVITAACNLGLSLALVRPFGITGVALGTLIPQFIQHQFSLIREASRELKIGLAEYLHQVHLKVVILTAVSALTLLTLKPLILASSHPLIWLVLASLGVVVFSTTLWFVWTGSKQEKTFFVLNIVHPFRARLNSHNPPPERLNAKALIVNE